MVFGLVVVAVIVSALLLFAIARLLRRRRRRRAAATMFVPTYPSIELEQPYGGWDADPYDARPGGPRVLIPMRLQPGSCWTPTRPR
jgi:hypothetical protein